MENTLNVKHFIQLAWNLLKNCHGENLVAHLVERAEALLQQLGFSYNLRPFATCAEWAFFFVKLVSKYAKYATLTRK